MKTFTGLGIAEARRRQAMVEGALQSADIPTLPNAEIARLLNVGLWAVRWGRRRLESSGCIPVVNYRLNSRGRFVDVSHLGSESRKCEAA